MHTIKTESLLLSSNCAVPSKEPEPRSVFEDDDADEAAAALRQLSELPKDPDASEWLC